MLCRVEVSYWIDASQSNANLLAAVGMDAKIKIYDRRESKIVKIIGEIHSGKNYPIY